MKTILLVLLFAGLVVHNEGLKEQDDAEDSSDLDLEGEKRIHRRLKYPYESYKPLADQLMRDVQSFTGDAARRARDMFLMLTRDWNRQNKTERRERGMALEAVTDNIGAKMNVHKDSTPAFIAVLNLMETLKKLNSSNGHIVSLPAMFTSSFMFLIGETSYPFPLKFMIQNEIKHVMAKYKEEDIVNSISATSEAYFMYKTNLNIKGRNNGKMSQLEADATNAIFDRTYMRGFQAINSLKIHMSNMKRDNRVADAKKYLAYAELCVKLETIREMMLTHLVSLFPESSPDAIKSILSLINTSKKSLKKYLKVLNYSKLQSKFMAYFDNRIYKVAQEYMRIQLGFRRGDVFRFGLYCITRVGHTDPFSWRMSPGKNHPYFAKDLKGSKTGCKWRIVSHDLDHYSIVNKYDCPNGPWCDALLSFDGGDYAIVTVEHNDPLLWKMTYKQALVSNTGYIINPGQFCGNKCKCSLSYYKQENQGDLDCSEYQLKVPQYWTITQGESSDMFTDSGSAAMNQSSENQIENSVSGDIAVDLSSDEDNGDNNFSGKSENEILEESKSETAEQSNQDSTGNEIED